MKIKNSITLSKGVLSDRLIYETRGFILGLQVIIKSRSKVDDTISEYHPSSSLWLSIIFLINRNISGRHYFAKSFFRAAVNRFGFGISFSSEEGMVARIKDLRRKFRPTLNFKLSQNQRLFL